MPMLVVGFANFQVDFGALGVMVSHHNEERRDESFVTRPRSGHGCNESLDAAVSHDHERQDEPFLTRLCHERYDAPPTPSTPGESELGEDEGSSQAMLSMLAEGRVVKAWAGFSVYGIGFKEQSTP